jgi:hypothetical protein
MNETSCKGLQNEQRCPVWHHLGTASGLEAEYRASLFFDLGSLFLTLPLFFDLGSLFLTLDLFF